MIEERTEIKVKDMGVKLGENIKEEQVVFGSKFEGMLQLLNNKIIKTKADITIEMDKLMKLSGVGHPGISAKTNVVSLANRRKR